MVVTLQKQDVKNDIAAAMSMCLAIDLDVVDGHPCCPFREQGVAKKAVDGLVRLLGRFEDHPKDNG
jgi:hypothetical protein